MVAGSDKHGGRRKQERSCAPCSPVFQPHSHCFVKTCLTTCLLISICPLPHLSRPPLSRGHLHLSLHRLLRNHPDKARITTNKRHLALKPHRHHLDSVFIAATGLVSCFHIANVEAFNPYINDPDTLKKIATNANGVTQEKSLECLVSFVKFIREDIA